LLNINDKIRNNSSNDHINKLGAKHHLRNNRKNYTPNERINDLKYKNLYNNKKHRNYSYSLKIDDKLINNIFKEDNEDITNFKIIKTKSNKLLNKLHCYTARQKYNNRSLDDINSNITTKLLKTMKQSINKNNTIHKVLKISNINIHKNYNSCSYINFINNTNIKIEPKYTNNKKIPIHNDSIRKDQDVSLFFENAIKSTSNLIDSMREERETNTFIKELKTGNNKRIFNSRFCYNNENNDITDEFYNKAKKIKKNLIKNNFFNHINNNANDNINYIKKNNYKLNRNYTNNNKNKTCKRYRNTWKMKSFRTHEENSNCLKEIPKIFNNKCIIRPANNA
jgi:hypothetical protein